MMVERFLFIQDGRDWEWKLGGQAAAEITQHSSKHVFENTFITISQSNYLSYLVCPGSTPENRAVKFGVPHVAWRIYDLLSF